MLDRRRVRRLVIQLRLGLRPPGRVTKRHTWAVTLLCLLAQITPLFVRLLGQTDGGDVRWLLAISLVWMSLRRTQCMCLK